jgi:Flp pilus assembly protein TadG
MKETVRTTILRDNRAQALVEMALVLTILLLVLAGIIEFGRVFSAQLIVSHASREGARFGVIHPGNDDDIVAKAKDAAGALDKTGVSVAVSAPSRMRGEQLTVQVEYQVAIIMPFIGGILPNPYTVRGVTKMRIE